MIRVQNLTKIYKSSKKKECKALDNVNLVLENKGLVFVLGKSGSGKSTLSKALHSFFLLDLYTFVKF